MIDERIIGQEKKTINLEPRLRPSPFERLKLKIPSNLTLNSIKCCTDKTIANATNSVWRFATKIFVHDNTAGCKVI